ncbi:MAG TPA: hypothetical protein VLL49_02105 [Anaerolineales bacterium]|nr:hypothetical protein [Anaerolineales bacterium]
MTQEGIMGQKKERQRLEGIWWAVVLIWAGLVFGADSMGVLPRFGSADAWSWIFLGAGVLGLLGALYRLSSPDAPSATAWDWVWAGIFLILGLGGFAALTISWPLILVLVGGAILVKAVGPRN